MSAEGIEDMGEFTTDRPAADNDETLVRFGRIGRTEKGFGSNIAAFLQSGYGGDMRASAGSDNNRGSGYFFRVIVCIGYAYGFFIYKRSRSGIDCYVFKLFIICLLYTSPSPRDLSTSRMPSSA